VYDFNSVNGISGQITALNSAQAKLPSLRYGSFACARNVGRNFGACMILETQKMNINITNNWDIIENEMRKIDPKEYCYFILSDDENSYVQTTGSKLQLTVEYRKTVLIEFKHFVLGIGKMRKNEIGITCSVGPVIVKGHEVLNIDNAIEVFKEFFANKTIPDQYILREVTDMFRR
jgi:hypothetical protein